MLSAHPSEQAIDFSLHSPKKRIKLDPDSGSSSESHHSLSVSPPQHPTSTTSSPRRHPQHANGANTTTGGNNGANTGGNSHPLAVTPPMAGHQQMGVMPHFDLAALLQRHAEMGPIAPQINTSVDHNPPLNLAALLSSGALSHLLNSAATSMSGSTGTTTTTINNNNNVPHSSTGSSHSPLSQMSACSTEAELKLEQAAAAALTPMTSAALSALQRRRRMQQAKQHHARERSVTGDEQCDEHNAGASPGKRLPTAVSDEKKDEAYWERRRKNNEAAKRSRDTRRQKEEEIALRATYLEQENLKLKAQVTLLKNESAKLHMLLYAAGVPGARLLSTMSGHDTTVADSQQINGEQPLTGQLAALAAAAAAVQGANGRQ